MSGVFVGRARELETLETLLAQAGGGVGKLALLTGEAGIGKSRLAEELARRAEAGGWRTAWGRSWEGAGTPSYWPWIQLLRRLTALPELAPAFGGFDLGALLDPAGRMPESPDAEQARFQLFDRVSRSLAQAAELRPLVLVLDDLHTADSATLGLLQFVARGLHGARILILATARDVGPAAAGPTSDLLARVAREAQAVPLPRLGREELGAWLGQAALRIDLERVWTLSEGNPLFVEEFLAAAKKRPDAAWTAQAMPLGVREAVRAHLVLVSDGALRLLETASVLGREQERAALKAVASPAEIDTLEEVLATGILQDAGEGRLRFSHVLLRDELYARLPEDRRRALHREVARASGSRAAAAHHALLGMRPEDAPATFQLVQEAMREASGRLAHEDAARLGESARALLESHLGPAELCALLVVIAEARVLAGDLPGGQALGEEAAQLADRLGLGELLARAVLTRAADLSFARDEPAVRWLRLGLQALPAGDSRLRALVMGRLSAALNNSASEVQEMRRLREDAVAMARRLGDEQALFIALHNLSGVFPGELEPRERFALYAETVDLAERLGTVGRIAPVLAWHVASWLELGEPAGARAAAARVEALLAPYARPHYQWRPPLIKAMLALTTGRFDEADRLARESFAISHQHSIREGLMMYAVYRSSVPYVRGDDGNVAEVTPLLETVFPPIPTATIFRAMWEAPLGRSDRVRDAFRLLKTLPIADVTGASQLGWACERAGIHEDAELFYQLALTVPKTLPLTFGPGGFATMGPVSLLVGRLAAMTGRSDEAVRAFETAARIGRELESPPFVAHAELGQAEVLAAEQPAAAAQHARIALEQARSVGMDVVATRAQRLVGEPRAVAAPAAAPALGLQRDGELWTLQAGEKRMTLRDRKGMAYLEALIAAPHRAVHVLELSGMGADGDAGPQLDDKARQAYRARAEELRAELEEATRFHDAGRIVRAQHELDVLGGELARAFGLGGRARRAGSAAERARINVQRRLRDVIQLVGKQDPAIGRHLELSVKTGLFCMYAPTWPQG